LRLTKARYEEGADTINDLLDAELALDQSETSLKNARYQLDVARAAFLLASGEL
jgi:outer membrane protein TolC